MMNTSKGAAAKNRVPVVFGVVAAILIFAVFLLVSSGVLARAFTGGGADTFRTGQIGDAAPPDGLAGSGGAWNGTDILLPRFSVPYDASEGTEFLPYTQYLAECSRDSFSLYNADGSEAFYKYVNFVRPALQKRGEYLLAYDIGGRSAFVMRGDRLIWEDMFTSVVVNASINADGYITFILEAAGYRNSVRVFAPAGGRLFDWVVADDYVTGAEVAPSGGELMINRLKTAGITLSSGLEFLDMEAEPFATLDSDAGSVFLYARYLGGGALAAATQDAVLLYSAEREPLCERTYDAVFALCEFPRGKAAAAVRSGDKTLLVGFDPEETGDGSGAVDGRAMYETLRAVHNMYADDGLLFVNLGDEAVVYDGNWKETARLAPDGEILYGGASEKLGVLIVTGRRAEVY